MLLTVPMVSVAMNISASCPTQMVDYGHGIQLKIKHRVRVYVAMCILHVCESPVDVDGS